MKLPTFHLNGSSAAALRDEYRAAYAALGAALTALAATHPHGSDYYPQDDDAFRAALAEHRTRVAPLTNVHTEIGALYAHCQEGVET
ncbi:hypothetical protein CCR94_18200 [Rhodoblastus sphagnicola]|uniref:Uncharacterized protein n=1 Tax=Rhodoblastus sphagnicola TaxID=333368 RepID=A0A2S6N0T0_9HYPH|nr:hypothetical protein [Rhodoblastus sphagnicola]MBB4200587.1 hypothetical protein [Rhodoblastus sphagnicola]PPQ28231.1 hypothetical protein CCR94_18200 [Rhodoblastus sphagnicola]